MEYLLSRMLWISIFSRHSVMFAHADYGERCDASDVRPDRRNDG